jgi:YARHG domain
MKRVALSLIGAMVVILPVASAPAPAQVQEGAFSDPVGLDPDEDNVLTSRSLPSGRQGLRLTRLGPDTLFTDLDRQGHRVNIQRSSGQTGWVSARVVRCCRIAEAAPTIRSSPAASSSCDDLWFERNAAFKAAGYCFHSPRGIRMFGNAGCQYDDEADVPLSARQREQVAQIRATERRLGCTP